jgi:hypothetical protein
MHRFRIACVFSAVIALVGCSTTNTPVQGSQSSSEAPSAAPTATTATRSAVHTTIPAARSAGTEVVRLDPWSQGALDNPAIAVAASEDNWCDVSNVSARSDAYMCLFKEPAGHAPDAPCFRNPSVPDEYACLEQDLTWQALRGLTFRGTETTRGPATEGNYVYLRLTDGTICSDVSKSGMEPVGDYGFQGSCDDGTSYYSRAAVGGPPSDNESPFGEGTDEQGRWLVKTSSTTKGQLTARSVQTAYR